MPNNNFVRFLLCMSLLVFACGASLRSTIPVDGTPILNENVVVAPGQSPKLEVEQGTPLSYPRARHTITRLRDDRILIVGGIKNLSEQSVEVEMFDPKTGSLTQAAQLNTPRHDHSATLLADGRVLVVGGYSIQQQWLSDAEVYDPSTNTWTTIPPLHSHGTIHSATLLKDGRVLVVGGGIGGGVCTERAEIFDPRTNSWAAAASLPSERCGQTADLLHNGNVLLAGGTNARGLTVDGDAFVYDPKANSWRVTDPMVNQRGLAESIVLKNGRVFVAGGTAADGEPVLNVIGSAEIYDPVSNTWSQAASLSEARFAYVLTMLPNGSVLAVGGARHWDSIWNANSFVGAMEVYDPAKEQWYSVGELTKPGAFSAGALLRDGRVWLAGGLSGSSGITFLSDTWFITFRANTITKSDAPANRNIDILVDDFQPQPYQGNTAYYYNRMDGDRGSVSDTLMDWEEGYAVMTIAPGSTWGGFWLSLSHPIREGSTINFSALLPNPIKSKYQSKITALNIQVPEATPNSTLKVELKNGNAVQWLDQVTLNGGDQTVNFKLPALQHINHLVLVLDQGQAGDYVVVKRILFTAETQISDTATAAFVWSYGMLLENWNPHTGLVRDKAKDASGEFDAIQATGNLAAATVVARQLGVINRADAIQIVNKISKTLLNDIPRYHGLLPHWVKASSDGEYVIVENTEWSSADTVIAVIGLLEAQTSLGLDTLGTEKLLEEIDWGDLVTDQGISHGYTHDGSLIPYAWDTFGGESWLIQLAYASVKGVAAPLVYPSPPTANGSGFIDELAWLYVPPPSAQDHWGTDWNTYRLSAVESQIAYYPTQDSTACFSQFGLFGLSAGEVPNPHMVNQSSIYQTYGIGGAFSAANDGSTLGASIVAPHYSAMIASLHPEETIRMWDWLIMNGYFSPLTNVESLAFQDNQNCDPQSVHWNQLKGSWNLSLQTLGWGRYLAEREGKVPVLWQAGTKNPLLQKGYALLAPNGPLLFTTYTPQPNEIAMTPIYDNTQVACAGKALGMDGSLGTYLPDLRRPLNDQLAWRIKE